MSDDVNRVVSIGNLEWVVHFVVADEITRLRAELSDAQYLAHEKEQGYERVVKEANDLRAELDDAKKWMRHAADIGHFSNCRKCGMPMRPGCICEACGWDRTEVSHE